MRSSRFSDEQIIGMIKEQEAGVPTAEVCRKHGISPASFYKYKAKFGGMEVSDARKLKALEDENAKLKKLLAKQMIDNAMLKDVVTMPPRRKTRARSPFFVTSVRSSMSRIQGYPIRHLLLIRHDPPVRQALQREALVMCHLTMAHGSILHDGWHCAGVACGAGASPSIRRNTDHDARRSG